MTPSINLTATEENHHKLDEIYDQIMGMFGDINVNCGLVRGFNTSKEHIGNIKLSQINKIHKFNLGVP